VDRASARALRETLEPERFEQLVSALTLVIGWEAMIVLQDTRRLSASDAEEVCVWVARAPARGGAGLMA
jgi:hypothetical protein